MREGFGEDLRSAGAVADDDELADAEVGLTLPEYGEGELWSSGGEEPVDEGIGFPR